MFRICSPYTTEVMNVKFGFVDRLHYKLVESTFPYIELIQNSYFSSIQIIHMAEHSRLENEQED